MLFILEKRGLQREFCGLSIYQGGESLFQRTYTNRTRYNGLVLKEGRLNMRKIFFTITMMIHWNKLPREVASPLKLFDMRFDSTLSNLV